MRRVTWNIMLALLMGVGLGLGYAWLISPHPMTAAQPSALRADFRDQYRSLVAAAYAATGNLPRAQARLDILRDPNPIDALNAQAQRLLANSQTFERADHLAALASALETGTGGAAASTPTFEIAIDAGETFTPTSAPALIDDPISGSETLELTEPGATVVETQPGVQTTATPTPVPGKPFTLTSQETVCDANLPDGLLQVLVLNRSRRQLAGVEIVITWEDGKEQFFTGLKPELGNGYADYTMTPDTTYTVQLARGSDVAQGITAPTCQSPDGTSFLGGVKLTFQQP
jgi:hypothetical protein